MDAMDEGTLDPGAVAYMAISWLSEDDVKEMCQENDLVHLDPSYNCDEDQDDSEEDNDEPA